MYLRLRYVEDDHLVANCLQAKDAVDQDHQEHIPIWPIDGAQGLESLLTTLWCHLSMSPVTKFLTILSKIRISAARPFAFGCSILFRSVDYAPE